MYHDNRNNIALLLHACMQKNNLDLIIPVYPTFKVLPSKHWARVLVNKLNAS